MRQMNSHIDRYIPTYTRKDKAKRPKTLLNEKTVNSLNRKDNNTNCVADLEISTTSRCGHIVVLNCYSCNLDEKFISRH